jgi:hypothetical protein
MGLLPEETVVAGILVAFAAHPDLIPPHLLQAHSDSNLDDIYRLPDVRTLDQPVIISKAKPDKEMSKRSGAVPCRTRSLR